MTQPTKLNDTIHPIFEGVKSYNLKQINQPQTLLIMSLRHKGFSYTQIARRLYAEHGIELSSQQVGLVCKKYYEKYINNL